MNSWNLINRAAGFAKDKIVICFFWEDTNCLTLQNYSKSLLILCSLFKKKKKGQVRKEQSIALRRQISQK